MDQFEIEMTPRFSRPIRQITLMLVILVLTGLGTFLALPRILPVFLANLYLNGFILFVFAIGVVTCFWQVGQLIGSVRWIEQYVSDIDRSELPKAPQLLVSLAALMNQRKTRIDQHGIGMQITSTSSRSILDSIAQRIDEEREITRYIVNVLIFLGLLGTFYGLAITIPAVVDTIRNLAPQEGDSGQVVFNRMMVSLEQQLGGMGVAFASSLLGLSGSLVVGLLELLAGHGQNRFYRELEEWLSTITRVSFTGGDGESNLENMIISHILDHLAEQSETLRRLLAQSDANNELVEDRLALLTDSISKLAQRMKEASDADITLGQVAIGQERILEQLQNRADNMDQGIDVETRMRIRSIDIQLMRIFEDISTGRLEMMSDIRSEIRSILQGSGAAEGQDSDPSTQKPDTDI